MSGYIQIVNVTEPVALAGAWIVFHSPMRINSEEVAQTKAAHPLV